MFEIAASSPGVWPLLLGTLFAALIAAGAAFYGPIRLARINAQMQEEREEMNERKAEERAEKDRQTSRDRYLQEVESREAVTRQVTEAAEKAEQARIDLARDNAETAREALRQQEAVAVQAQAAAKLLVESNERIAAHAAAAAQMTQEKLKEIHTLVDGSYTAAMRGELNALKAHRATLQELIADRKGTGREPGRDTIRTLEELEVEIATLEIYLQERLEQVAKAEAAGQTGLREE